ncbi:hypothetical protein FS837_001792 [Tulasnella sp. UAMH 9824]|nr:hypothetical protein FS837_001792 [Tulasnella sp. UAMH 9824]
MDRNDNDPNARDSSLPSGRQQELTLPWIIFGGSRDESSVEFIQLVQRLAFRHGRASHDAWIAQYASTCFSDDALIWYSELESETRESWATLRLALLRRYPPPTKRTSNDSLSNVYPRTRTSQSELFETIGIIKVLRMDWSFLGFVAFDRISGCATITRELERSVWVGLPKYGHKSEALPLYMV